MTQTEILQQITPVFRKVFNDNGLNLEPAHSAADFDKWDSINHVILIARIEKLFNINIDTAELMQLKTIGDLLNIIEKKVTL